MIDNGFERAIDDRVRIALRQQSYQRREMRNAIERMRVGQQSAGAQAQSFHHIMTEMLVQARPPYGGNRIARLQYWAHARARPAPYQSEMAAVLARHQFQDGVRFAMPPHAQHYAFVSPFHADVYS